VSSILHVVHIHYYHCCSCEPCCEIKYAGGAGNSEPLQAAVVALRDISEGEELMQSYIDKELSLQERNASLQDYGFVCDCTKCQRERGSSAACDMSIA
jgi:hypothetical protein